MAKQVGNTGVNWYVIHTYSGYEDAVRQALFQRIETMNMADYIFDVVVPKANYVALFIRKILVFYAFVVIGYFVHNETAHLTLAIGGMTLILLGIVIVCYFGKHTTWLNTAADLPTTSCKVPDAAEVLRLSPYLGLLCIFWGVYGQMSNNFFNQGCQMDLRLGDGDDPALLSANLLNLFDTFVILVFVPIFE